jgi:hypothetical protein
MAKDDHAPGDLREVGPGLDRDAILGPKEELVFSRNPNFRWKFGVERGRGKVHRRSHKKFAA